MPTVRQLQAAKKKLKVTEKPNNSPRLPNVATFRIISTDPKTIRIKEMNKYKKEMELRKKQYMNALAALKKLKRK
jgi:hypothetical protein